MKHKTYALPSRLPKREADKLLNGGGVIRKKGSGRFSKLDEAFEAQLDTFLISVNGDVTYEDVIS